MRERAVFASTLHSSIPHRISFYSTRFYTALIPTLSLSLSLWFSLGVCGLFIHVAMFIRLSVAFSLFTLFRFIFLPLCGCQFYLPLYCTNLTFICPALLALLPPPPSCTYICVLSSLVIWSRNYKSYLRAFIPCSRNAVMHAVVKGFGTKMNMECSMSLRIKENILDELFNNLQRSW